MGPLPFMTTMGPLPSFKYNSTITITEQLKQEQADQVLLVLCSQYDTVTGPKTVFVVVSSLLNGSKSATNALPNSPSVKPPPR